MDSGERWREDDAAALAERLAALRLLSHDIAEAVASIPDPESFLDGERAAKAVIHADQMLARLPDDPNDDDDMAPDDTATLSPPHPTRSPQRLKLRTTADRVLAAIHSIPKPDSFIEADRAARCVLASQAMLTQLYTDPKPGKLKQTFADDPDDDLDPNDPNDRRNWKYPDPHAEAFRRLDRFTRVTVDVCGGGLWPDGTPYDSHTPTNEDLFEDSDCKAFVNAHNDRILADIPGENQAYRWFTYTIAGRVNVIARAHAERTGKWPNGKTYVPGEPDIYFISRTFEDRAIRGLDKVPKPDDEITVPCFPYWMVSKKLDYDTG